MKMCKTITGRQVEQYLPFRFIAVCVILLLSSRSFTVYGQSIAEYQKEKQLVEIWLADQAAIDTLVDNMIRYSYALKASEAELNQKYEMVGQEKRRWLSTFIVGISLYSQSTTYSNVDNTAITTAGVFPNMGVSLSINPEKLINIQSNVRIAEQGISRVENTMKEQRRALKNFIMAKYYEYLEALNVLEIRYNVHETQRQQAEEIKLKFERGEAKLDEVLLVQNGLASTEEALMRAKVFVLKLKAEIGLYTTDSEAQQP